MNAPITVQRKQRKARKLDREKVLDLHQKGLNTVEIAQHQGVSPSSVWRFLQQSVPEQQALEQFKDRRADVLARIQAKSLDVQESIIDSLKEGGVLNAFTPYQKTGLISVLSAQMGTAYDKERLERGQSTHNVSLVHRMMAEAFDRAGKNPPCAEAPQDNPEG